MSYYPMAGLPEIAVPEWTGELGREPEPHIYIGHLVLIFREIRRVLKDTGTAWCNIADSAAGSGMGVSDTDSKQSTNKGSLLGRRTPPYNLHGKNWLGIPQRLILALQGDGWIYRDELIWQKPNPMPYSGKDRTTRAHEQVFMVSKSPKYYFDGDSIKTPVKPHSIKRLGRAVKESHKNASGAPGQTAHSMFKARPNTNKQDALGKRQYRGFNERYDGSAVPMANHRSVFTVPTQGTKFKHFASYPEKLIEPFILAGCPEGGTVLDPFFGTGTTGLVARQLKRHYIGIELSPDYILIAKERLRQPFEKHYLQESELLEELPLFSPDLNTEKLP